MGGNGGKPSVALCSLSAHEGRRRHPSVTSSSFGDLPIAPHPKERGNGENLGFSLFVYRGVERSEVPQANLGFSLFVHRFLNCRCYN